ncbi:MAG TPA: hypothetical protein VF501_00670 [Thiobacillus sp.]
MAYDLRALPQPGLLWGLYPEQRPPAGEASWLSRLNTWSARFARAGLGDYAALASRSDIIEQDLRTLDRAGFDQALQHLRQNLASRGLDPELVAQAFALVSLACQRQLGQSPFATQRLAAAVMLDNRLAEMATGEGKTLAALLAAATGALAGIPVHVITANDYLVARDAAKLQPVYAALGLSVGAVQQRMNSQARRTEYARDVTSCTARELVFDYLRDLSVRGRYRTELAWRAARLEAPATARSGTLLRGLCMAVIDEADSILIDEARTPFVISEQHHPTGRDEAAVQLLQLAATLQVGTDFLLDDATQSATLNEAGRAALAAQAGRLHPVWRNPRRAGESLCLALSALHLFRRDRHYLVRDGGIHLIDETTGRLAPGRTWSRGLHQFIELKEGCTASPETVTRAQITYQRFFPRYFRLCGMSGTLTEARGELARVYGLPVVKLPLRRPSRRVETGHRVFLQRTQQWQAVAERANRMLSAGRPVLIGTDSVADSESLSAHLARAGLAHAVLNARHDGDEAAIVALAGQPGRLTIATNMAGRGTDIPLGAGVAARGGLHVISCQTNGARRIDRQLMGRCARQGDPGSVDSLLSLDVPLMARSLPQGLLRLAAKCARRPDGSLPTWLGRLLATWAQRLEETRHRAQRALMLHQDRQLDGNPVFRE